MSIEKMPKCLGCGREIDLDFCWCGSHRASHGLSDNHPFIPMGCDCHRVVKRSAPSEVDVVEWALDYLEARLRTARKVLAEEEL